MEELFTADGDEVADYFIGDFRRRINHKKRVIIPRKVRVASMGTPFFLTMIKIGCYADASSVTRCLVPLYRLTDIVIVPRETDGRHPPEEPLETELCKWFYDRRKRPFKEIIGVLRGRKQKGVKKLLHLKTCDQCRLHIQMREQDSSPTLMDMQIEEALRETEA